MSVCHEGPKIWLGALMAALLRWMLLFCLGRWTKMATRSKAYLFLSFTIALPAQGRSWQRLKTPYRAFLSASVKLFLFLRKLSVVSRHLWTLDDNRWKPSHVRRR